MTETAATAVDEYAGEWLREFGDDPVSDSAALDRSCGSTAMYARLVAAAPALRVSPSALLLRAWLSTVENRTVHPPPGREPHAFVRRGSIRRWALVPVAPQGAAR